MADVTNFLRHHFFEIYILVILLWAFSSSPNARCFIFGHKHFISRYRFEGDRNGYVARQRACHRCLSAHSITYTYTVADESFDEVAE